MKAEQRHQKNSKPPKKSPPAAKAEHIPQEDKADKSNSWPINSGHYITKHAFHKNLMPYLQREGTQKQSKEPKNTQPNERPPKTIYEQNKHTATETQTCICELRSLSRHCTPEDNHHMADTEVETQALTLRKGHQQLTPDILHDLNPHPTLTLHKNLRKVKGNLKNQKRMMQHPSNNAQ
uniref:Uncharacterized protein n=1 Tax=Pipistrellus kuhlii TaxID=59472 RepID=A0A7J7SEE5_PIPKU|nr:hypothetical protein mPipKuh1_010010 [Pipistrellus kuhlii]